MKKILGSILIITINIFASSLCDFNLTLSNHSPYVKEGVKIEFSVTQKDISQAMFFEFTPQKSKDYELVFIKKEIIPLSSSRKKSHYEYVLYPLHSGKIGINFKLIVKQASLEDLHGVFTIGQYQVPNLRTTNTNIDIKEHILDVQSLPDKTELVGEYELDFSLDKSEVRSNEQVNLLYHFKGDGYIKDNLKKILPEIESVHYYEDIVDNSKFFHHDVIYNYALVSQKSFKIPAISYKCFNPKTKKTYFLKIDSKDIDVKVIDQKDLLDDKNSYTTSSFDFSTLIPYVNAILIFLAGYISAYIVQKRVKTVPKIETFEKEILKCKDRNELLKLLLSKGDKKYESIMDKIYTDKNLSLKNIKKEILDA